MPPDGSEQADFRSQSKSSRDTDDPTYGAFKLQNYLQFEQHQDEEHWPIHRDGLVLLCAWHSFNKTKKGKKKKRQFMNLEGFARLPLEEGFQKKSVGNYLKGF